MRLTRWSHSCVALETEGHKLVLDPGGWSEPQALDGAHAVLVTHEHGDHVDIDRVRASGLPVWAPRGSDLDDLAYTPIDPGQSLRIEGFEVTAVGGRHAAVVPGQEVCANLGYVVTADDESVYHPGDALAVPDGSVTTLLVPMQASWLKTEEAIGFVRAVRPDRAVGIHDGQVNDRARDSINHWLATEGGADYHWLAPGTTFGEDGGGLPRVSQLRLVVEVEDFDAAVAFYRDALGLPVELDLAGDGGEHVLILDAGRATLELSNPAQVAMIDDVEVGRRVAPRLRVAFEVDDAGAATQTLVEAGAELVAPPTGRRGTRSTPGSRRRPAFSSRCSRRAHRHDPARRTRPSCRRTERRAQPDASVPMSTCRSWSADPAGMVSTQSPPSWARVAGGGSTGPHSPSMPAGPLVEGPAPDPARRRHLRGSVRRLLRAW